MKDRKTVLCQSYKFGGGASSLDISYIYYNKRPNGREMKVMKIVLCQFFKLGATYSPDIY